MGKDLITPRTLKGFRDYPPALMLPREHLIDTAKAVYREFGFAPIDTPALEYTEILLGKGSDETDRQLYSFTTSGGRDVTLRFDLTVPLARFVAQHSGQLGMPFKRYHVGSVWRGENTQRGRYREFVQCDFDTIGSESALADVEVPLVMATFLPRIGFERFSLRLNHRGILNGVLERLELGGSSVPVLRALDKLAKIGPDKVVEEMQREAGAGEAQAREVLRLGELAGSVEERLSALAPMVAGTEVGEAGLQRLQEIFTALRAAGIGEEHATLDLSIARGLDYYTGFVYETFLDDLPGIGSVSSGGRYDDLASLYTKERLPGVGGSIGIDRLLSGMEELGMIEERQTPAQVFLPLFDVAHQAETLALAMELRQAGLQVELYPDKRKLGAQLKYADRRGFRFAVIAGESELAAGTAQLKDLADGSSQELPRGELADAIRGRLGGAAS